MPAKARDAARFRPRVERLESMLLLSHSQTMLSPVRAEAKTPTAPVDVALAGTLHGTGKLSGSEATASGSGNLGKVGTASFSLKVNVDDPPSKLTLSTRKGTITLAAEGSVTQLTSGYSVDYEVVGGTKSYAKAAGSGIVTATYEPFKKDKLTLTLAFS